MTKDKAIRSMRQIAREGQNWLKNPTKPFIQDLRFGTGTTCYAGSIDPQSANEDLSRIDRILVFFHGNNKSDLALHIDRKVEIIKSCIQSVSRLVEEGRRHEQCLTSLKQAVRDFVSTCKNTATTLETVTSTDETDTGRGRELKKQKHQKKHKKKPIKRNIKNR